MRQSGCKPRHTIKQVKKEEMMPNNMMKILKNTVSADSFGKNKDGNFVLRRGFFYRNNLTAQYFVDSVRKALAKRNDIEFEIVESGEVWKAFRGGASLANSSHWWVIVRVTLKADQEVKA